MTRGRIRAETRTGLYSQALPEPPIGGVSAHAGDDPFRGGGDTCRDFSCVLRCSTSSLTQSEDIPYADIEHHRTSGERISMANSAHIYKSKSGNYNISFHHPICREGSIGKKIHRSLKVSDEVRRTLARRATR